MSRRKKDKLDKITRKTIGTLMIETKDDEVAYRNKFLSDPFKLPDVKLVCTVCAKSLSRYVRTGKQIFEHMFLSVLLCEDCYKFYGDGVFSADDDGDEKYCRWCGQGGTLSVCSICTCGFCKQCLKHNLKSSALAKVEQKGWMCLICNPRPIYGTRAILWAAQKISRSVNEKYNMEYKIRENVRKTLLEIKLEEETRRKLVDKSLSENGPSSRKRKHCSGKLENGGIDDSKNKLLKMSSESDSYETEMSDLEDNKKRKVKHKHKKLKQDNFGSVPQVSKSSKFGHKKRLRSHSDSSSDEKFKSHIKKSEKTKKLKKHYSSDSSETYNKYKKKHKKRKKMISSDSSEGDEERKSRERVHKQLSSSDEDNFVSFNEKTEIKKPCPLDDPNVLKPTEINNEVESGLGPEFDDKVAEGSSQYTGKASDAEKSGSDNLPDEGSHQHTDTASEKQENLRHDNLVDGSGKCTQKPSEIQDNIESNKIPAVINQYIESDSISKIEFGQLNTCIEPSILLRESGNESQDNFDSKNTFLTSCQTAESKSVVPAGLNTSILSDSVGSDAHNILVHGDNVDPDVHNTLVHSDSVGPDAHNTFVHSDSYIEQGKVEENIKLVIDFLNNTISDIVTIGGLVSTKANELFEEHINPETLNSYDDILNVLIKLKRLSYAVHQNCYQIENSLEERFDSWKVLVGLEKPREICTINSDNINSTNEINTFESIGSKKNNENNLLYLEMFNFNLELIQNNEINDIFNTTTVLVQNESMVVDQCTENCKKDEHFEALQAMLCTSSEDESKTSENSDSDSSSKIYLDDSDLEDILKPPKKKAITVVKKKKKEVTEDNKVDFNNEKNQMHDSDKENNKIEDNLENDEQIQDEAARKDSDRQNEDKLDSEAEIEMLTDLTKLKRKAFSRKSYVQEGSEEGSDEESSESGEELKENARKRRKCNNESKKRREEERNELFKFLDDSNTSNEEDLTKKDLDLLEEHYASSSNSSMSLKGFTQKMTAKFKQLEKEQEQMNLQLLLAPDSDEDEGKAGSIEGDDDILLSDDAKKKKKANKKLLDGEKVDVSSPVVDEEDVTIKEEDKDPDKIKENVKIGGNEDNEKQDIEYEEFVEGLEKARVKFEGLGSSSDEKAGNEPLNDEGSLKKEKESSGVSSSSVDSDSSTDLFVDKGKSKSMKNNNKWRNHKLLRTKLSDTDTSDEERWWQRRIARDKRKKEKDDDGYSDSGASGKYDFTKSVDRLKTSKGKKLDNNSGNENRKEMKEEDEAQSSSIELSSSELSDSSLFKNKKKRKKDKSSDSSDVIIVSEDDKKKPKKKKKKQRQIGDSDDSSGSGDNLGISQKSTLGESPGKGGRKNIRKVLTKHELAAATKAAAKEEEERKRRIAARQKVFNEIFEIKEAEVLKKLVLDFDPDTKTELISVDTDLVHKMKPHQAKGVKFMWDSCFESLSELQKKKGSGCILAHCMGLGKTFQVISLVHTILSHKDTKVKTVLVVCPLSTVLNWQGEFRKWLDDVAGGKNIKTYHLTNYKKPHERARHLTEWHTKGGVMIMGYEMFRNLSNHNSKLFRLAIKEIYQKTLLDPGADLVVCDEGHMLKNESTLLSKAMSRIRTLRRIVLTGTPMQNNLKEYHCMVQFVKPNLLGTRKEFLNQFVNPITNGQFVDSTETDVKVMKRRAHVLHKMLEGLVQRFDYSVLTPFLPPKHEYVVSVRLSDVQVKLYQFYMKHFTGQQHSGSQLFLDWQALGRIWTHPRVLMWCTEKAEKELEKKRLEESDEESDKNLVNDKSSSLSVSSDSSSSSRDEGSKKKETKNDKNCKHIGKEKGTPVGVEMEINLISSEEDEVMGKNGENPDKCEEGSVKQNHDAQEEDNKLCESERNIQSDKDDADGSDKDDENEDRKEVENDHIEAESEEKENKQDSDDKVEEEKKIDSKFEEGNKVESKKVNSRGYWWRPLIEPSDLETINTSAKLVLLFAILQESSMIEDKVLVFSQSLFSLDLIEYFLEKIDKATKDNSLDDNLGNHAGLWAKGKDYFRLDGSTSSENRSTWCKAFNREDNTRARLFLISTRAGGLGINLTAANRVVIFDASWNPSHDIQSIFRVYRFGQKKACYVYRFVAQGTMEEKVYERQVAKQSLSSRVVDEQQVHRHFSSNDLNELYTFTPPSTGERETPVLPKDRMMAELLTKCSEWIEKYHEHDSLLENVAEEQLNEEERQLAWEDYENDKKRGFIPPGAPNLIAFDQNKQFAVLQASLRAKYPNASEQEMNQMLKTVMQQVYWHNQAKQQAQPSTSLPQPQRSMMNTSNLSPQQSFALQRQHLYQKYGQEINKNKNVGNAQIRQRHRLETNVGNAQMNQTLQAVSAQANFGNSQNQRMGNRHQNNYQEQMRLQQQMNWARVQNQKRIQEVMQHRGTATGQLGAGAATSGQFQGQKPYQSTKFVNKRQLEVTPINSESNKLMQKSALMSKRQLEVTPINSGSNKQMQKSAQQLRLEQMHRTINLLHEKQKSEQVKRNISNPSLALPDVAKRQLEEMKKRYKASRTKISSNDDISIVEIDDDPSPPSASTS